MRQPDAIALAEVAKRAAEEAGAFVMRGFRSRPNTRSKADVTDLVTEFDEASERLIRACLSRDSDLPIVGEEGGGHLGEAATWVIDPIDGTTNFVHGHPFFAVSIGVLEAGAPVAGAVVAPALGVTWHGTAAGSYRNGEPIAVTDTKDLRQALLATGFGPTQSAEEAAANVAVFHRLLGRTRGLRRDGSAALDLCLTADGTFDAYWEQWLRPWDMAGGAAIATGAGATITDFVGGPADYSRGFILASNGHLHPNLLEALASLATGASGRASSGPSGDPPSGQGTPT